MTNMTWDQVSRRRVWAAWTILGISTLLEAVAACWLAYVTIYWLTISKAFAGMAVEPPPERPIGSSLTMLAAVIAFGGAFGFVVGVLQRLALRSAHPALRGWILRNALTAAFVSAGAALVMAAWNRLGGTPSVIVAMAQFAGIPLLEGGAMFAIQRRRLAAATSP